MGRRSDSRFDGVDDDRLFANDFGGHERGNASRGDVTGGRSLPSTHTERQPE
jgi:hypothetical protein